MKNLFLKCSVLRSLFLIDRNMNFTLGVRRIISLMLSFLMILGIFAGTKMDVLANLYNGFEYYVNEDGTARIAEYTGTSENLIIPDTIYGHTVTWISEGSIRNPNLKTVKIPATVNQIDRASFFECPKLTEINVDVNNKRYYSDNGVLFDRINKMLVQYPAGRHVNEYKVPLGTAIIGEYAFWECSINSIVLSETVSELDWYAVYAVENVDKVLILNRNCKIQEENSIQKDIAIFGYNYSSAQRYAKEHNRTFVYLPVHSVQEKFKDLSDYEYYNGYVEYVSLKNHFISGTNPPAFTEFSPKTSITRAMFVTILYRMAGEPYANSNPYSSSPFTDIKDTSVYYYDAACWALDEGITNQTTFKPFDNVTREQTASFLFRYAEGIDSLGSDEYKNVDLTKYSDNKNISSWAAESMQWANYNSMITGTQQGTANPQGATQRIHATKILYGFGKTCNIGNFE